MNTKQALKEVENYLTSLRNLVNSSPQGYLSCFELLQGLEAALSQLYSVIQGGETEKQHHHERLIVQFIVKLLADKTLYREQVSHEALLEYLTQVEADFFAFKFRENAFWQWIKRRPLHFLSTMIGVVVLTFFIVWLRQDRREDVWRVSYYSETGMSGKKFGPVFNKHLWFDWQLQSPISQENWDRFSLVAQSCFRVPAGQGTVRWRVASDDGYRLFVDNHKIADNWVSQGESWHEIQADFSEGWHLLELQYFDAGGLGSLKVEMATSTAVMGPADERILKLPKVKPNGALTCI